MCVQDIHVLDSIAIIRENKWIDLNLISSILISIRLSYEKIIKNSIENYFSDVSENI